jgi:hypothetical protein
MLQHFTNKSKRFQQLTILIVGLIVVGIGTYLLTGSYAAAPYTNTSASSGSLVAGNSGSASTLSCTAASSGTCIAFGATNSGGTGTTPYSGKLLGMNTSLGDVPSGTTHITVLKELGVNSERGEIDFNGTVFGNPDYEDGTSSNWVGTLTASSIVPLPEFDDYQEMSLINASAYAAGVVSWCQQYCAGGSYFSTTNKNTQYSAYGAQAVEILNEPYGNWWGYQNNTTTDPADYAALIKDVKSGLVSAGFSDVAVLASSNAGGSGAPNSSYPSDWWDSAVAAAGGFSAADGIVVHTYFPEALTNPYSYTYSANSAPEDWDAVYYEHDKYNKPIYVTETGWCTTGQPCSGGANVSQSVKDNNIAGMIGQLADVSWIKGIWYYNLMGDDGATYGIYNGTQTCAWPAFQSAAMANGFSVEDQGDTASGC